MKKTVKITGIITGIIVTGLVLQLSNFSNIELQTAEAEKPKEKTFDEYKKWATNEIKKFKIQIIKLKSQLIKSEKTVQELQAEVRILERKNVSLENQVDYYEERLVEYEDFAKKAQKTLEKYNYLTLEDSRKSEPLLKTGPPKTTIKGQTVYWDFTDSAGHEYNWQMPIATYEYNVQRDEPFEYFSLQLPSGKVVTVVDHTRYVETSFTDVIDDIYDNAGSDAQFLYETWYLISQMTTYSYEIEEYPRYALETFSRGGGDCEDTAILFADMLRSSKHAQNWTIQLVYFDSENPYDPKSVNHVAVYVDTGEISTIIETTGKTVEEANSWNDKNIFGWSYDV